MKLFHTVGIGSLILLRRTSVSHPPHVALLPTGLGLIEGLAESLSRASEVPLSSDGHVLQCLGYLSQEAPPGKA